MNNSRKWNFGARVFGSVEFSILDCQAMLHQNNIRKIEDDILTDNSDFDCPDLRRDLEGSENWKTETRSSTTKRDKRHSLRSVVTRP
jgi:hypothetical protein